MLSSVYSSPSCPQDARLAGQTHCRQAVILRHSQIAGRKGVHQRKIRAVRPLGHHNGFCFLVPENVRGIAIERHGDSPLPRLFQADFHHGAGVCIDQEFHLSSPFLFQRII